MTVRHRLKTPDELKIREAQHITGFFESAVVELQFPLRPRKTLSPDVTTLKETVDNKNWG